MHVIIMNVDFWYQVVIINYVQGGQGQIYLGTK